MGCLRCGREVEEGQAFCQDCLIEMGKYPIDPNTVVQIPVRTDGTAGKKAARRRGPSPEEQIQILKRRVRILTAAVILLAILSISLSVLAYRIQDRFRFRPGQNYTSVISTQPPSTSASAGTETLGEE